MRHRYVVEVNTSEREAGQAFMAGLAAVYGCFRVTPEDAGYTFAAGDAELVVVQSKGVYDVEARVDGKRVGGFPWSGNGNDRDAIAAKFAELYP